MVLTIRPSSTLWPAFLGFSRCLCLNFFLIKLIKFLAMFFGCGCFCFYHIWYLKGVLKTFSSHPLSMNKKVWLQKPLNIFENVEKNLSLKRKTNFSFIRVIKNSSFDQSFISGPNLSKKSLLIISCSLLRITPR